MRPAERLRAALAGLGVMEQALARLAAGALTAGGATLERLQEVVGFPDYFEAEPRCAAGEP